MQRYSGIVFLVFSGTLLLAGPVLARPAQVPELAIIETGEGLVGDLEGTLGAPQKVLQDTTWIADWSFDGPGGTCTSTGWVEWDNRILKVVSRFLWKLPSGRLRRGGPRMPPRFEIVRPRASLRVDLGGRSVDRHAAWFKTSSIA